MRSDPVELPGFHDTGHPAARGARDAGQGDPRSDPRGGRRGMRLSWVGVHQEGLLALRALLEAGVRIDGVLTLRPELAARRSGAAEYAGLCREFGVPLHEIGNINDAESVRILRALAPDVLFVIGWSQLLRTEALATARVGVVGAHASLLPHNRGSAPVNWALIHGEARTGNTLLWLTDAVDAGDVIDQTAFCITPYDSCATLYERVAESNRDMLLRLVQRLHAGETVGTRQPHGTEPVLPRRRPEDGLVDWGRPGRAVYDFVRALTRPYPGAFGYLDGRRWTVWQSALLPLAAPVGARPGEVLGPVVSPAPGACGQVVACGSGAVVLLEVQSEAGDVLVGRHLSEQRWTGLVFDNA